MNRSIIVLALAMVVAMPAAGDGPAVSHDGPVLVAGDLSYELATDGRIESHSLAAFVPVEILDGAEPPYFEQDSVRETAALANFIVGLQSATETYFAELIAFCEAKALEAEIDCSENTYPDLSCAEYIVQEKEYIRLRCLGNEPIPPDVNGGLSVMSLVEDFLADEAAVIGGDLLEREIELAADITANMTESGAAPPYNDEGMGGTSPWSSPGSPGGLGATPGGAQDIGYIRAVVEEGFVPLPTHLAAEGLFSEHDLPIESDEPCDQLLCIRSAVGLAPAFDTGELRFYVQIGFSSGIDPDTFERPPLNLVAVVDKSGSMNDRAGAEGIIKIEAVKIGLGRLVDQLDEDDRLAIVLFDHYPWVLLDSTPVVDPDGIKDLIRTIHANGGTNIEAGLELGFEIAAQHAGPAERFDRVMLLTDALPNVGHTGEGAFLTLARDYADQGIGLSTFGVGFNFGQELILELSRIRGGNYFFLEDDERIIEVFETDFDYLVTPLAYDLSLGLEPGFGFEARRAHGVPTSDSIRGDLDLEITTIFLSRRRGAVLLELAGVPAARPGIWQFE